ncbi:MAG TPA: hypothetical protein VF559_11875 [Caulobacteraceae bacterium]|jgi:hypothetical protein
MLKLLAALAVAMGLQTLPAAAAAAASPLDVLAPDYVTLLLEVGEHDEGYIDAYTGPPEWQARAKARGRQIPAVRADVETLSRRISAVPAKALDPMERRRREAMLADLKAARVRLDLREGKRLPFRDEAEAMLGWRPELKPLSAYDPILARIEAIVPGSGPLAERVDAFKMRYVIPKDRLEPVMRAAIAECRRRTAAHIALPKDERFDLEFVTNKSWSGYNWYKGANVSLIQINTDLPIFIDRAVDLGCHEGYPGHHVRNLLGEERMLKGRGWREYSVQPLFSPTSFISEGTGNYGIDLAFPGAERTAFEARTLYPLAGLDPGTAEANSRLREAMFELANARATISADYLDGRIDKETAIRLIQKYQLVSRKRAEQLIAFTDQYRSYVINYGLGQDAVRAYVERAGPSAAARWKAFERLIAEPTLPRELR